MTCVCCKIYPVTHVTQTCCGSRAAVVLWMGSEVNGHSCWHCVCVHRKMVSRCHILSGSLEGNWQCFCFLFSSTPKSPTACWLSRKEGMCACVCLFEDEHLCVCMPTCSWMHVKAYLLVCVCVLCTLPIHTTHTSRSGSALDGNPSKKKRKKQIRIVFLSVSITKVGERGQTLFNKEFAQCLKQSDKTSFLVPHRKFLYET